MNSYKKNRLFFVAMAGMMVFASLLFMLSSGAAFAATWGPTSITDTNDDGYEWEGGPDWYANNQPYGYNYIGYDDGRVNIGLRFTNITIPQGATINGASIEVYHSASDRSGTPRGQWQAWDVDSAGQFVDGGDRPSTVPLTTAYVTHNPTSGAGWKSASIGSVIQEIINRTGWVSGNAINLVWMSTNSSAAWADFNDVRQGSNPARLTINYDQQGGTYSSTSPITIPDSGSATPYPSTITVPSLSGTVTKVTVTINGLTHTYPDDVRILLVGPQGQNVMLMYYQGDEWDVDGVILTFDDSAASELPDSQITSGTYKPCSDTPQENMNSPAPVGPYGTTLSVFDGVDPQGDWSLYVLDYAANDSGTISGGWELNITTDNICWSSELLTNPGFETGDDTGWSNGGGGTVAIGWQCSNWCDDAPHSGSYQAYWETTAAGYYLYQDVDLSSYASDIDAGDALVTATGFLISNEYDPSPYDVFYMQVRFYDGPSSETSSEIVAHRYDTGTVNNPNWDQYGIIEPYTIPTGARCVQIRFYTWETDGSNWYNAGSADDFSVKVGTPCGGGGVTISFQEGDGKGTPSEIDDAWLDASLPDDNYGSSQDLEIDESSIECHAVIKFPNIFGGGANQIPLGSTIHSATLTVVVFDEGDNPDVYQLIEGWVESEVTWNSRSTGVSWSDPGADGTTSRKSTAEGSIIGTMGAQSVDVTTSVQNWSDGEANEGWLLEDTGSGGLQLRSSEYTTASERPMLTVIYTPPTILNQAHVRWRNDDGEEGGGGTITETGSNTASSTSTTDASITHGLTINEGDVIIVVIHQQAAGGIADNNGAYPFTELIDETGPSTSGYAIYSRVAGASEPSTYSWTTGNVQWTLVLRVFSGVDTSDIWDVPPSGSTKATSTGSTPATALSMTISTAGAMGIVVVGTDSSSITYSNPTNGYGTGVQINGARSLGTYIRTFDSTGPSGATSVTLSTSDDWFIHQFALKPAASGSGATFSIDEDTELVGLAKNTNTRVRFLVSNSGGPSSGVNYQLEFSETDTCGSGSYSPVPTSAGSGDKWEIVDSTHYTDPTATEDITDGVDDALPNPGGMTFVPGELRDDNSNSTSGITLDQDEFTEIEFTIQATDDAVEGTHYCFRLTDSGTELNSYSYYAEVTLAGVPPNAAPTLTVNQPDGTGDTVAVGDTYDIYYDLADSDDVVTVAFYYDSDSSGFDGIALTGACASGAEGTNVSCSWDTTGMTPGSYYVYGVTNDGTNPDVKDYSPGQITINAASAAILNQAHYRWRNDDGGESGGSSTAVSDTFTESVNTILTSHTPDTGTGWTEIYDSSPTGDDAMIVATEDIVRAGSSVNDVGQAYTAQPAPTGVDQDLSIALNTLISDTGTKPFGLFGRRTDNSNFYHVQILPNAHAEASVKLWKFVSGVDTELGSYDATLAVGDVIKLEIRDATKKVYINGVERISSSDNSLTSVGTWGLYFGNFNGAGAGGHLRVDWRLDDFLAEEPSGISETGSATNIGTSNAVSITHGLTINANDVVIALIHVNNETPNIADNNGANSFTEQIQETNGSETSGYAIFYRIAGASEPSTYSWTLDGSWEWSIQIRVFSGVDNSSVWDVAPSTSTKSYAASGTSATALTMTTSNNGAMGIIAFFSDSLETFSNPTNGYGTEVEPASSRAQASYIRKWTTAGATGASSATLSATNDWLAHQFALKPATSGGGATFDIDEDTELTGLAKNTNIRVRFLVSNSGGTSSGAVNYQLEFAETDTCGSGSYSPVPTSAGAGDKWDDGYRRYYRRDRRRAT